MPDEGGGRRKSWDGFGTMIRFALFRLPDRPNNGPQLMNESHGTGVATVVRGQGDGEARAWLIE